MQYKAANYSEEGECDSHFFYENVIESPLKSSTSIEDALDWIGQYLKCDNPIIELDYDIILEIRDCAADRRCSFAISAPIGRRAPSR